MYIDGSAQFPTVPFLRRCGYAVVSLDDWLVWSVQLPPAFSLAACAVYVPLKRQLHAVPASETVALLCALRNSDPPLQVGYDGKVVGDTWRGGSGTGTSAKSPMADLWRKTWAELDQPRWKGQFNMFKLKSLFPFDSSWTCERKRDWAGNEVADLAAKRALEAWRSDAQFADQYCGWVKFARAVATSVAKSQSFWLQNLPTGANDVRTRETAHLPQPPRLELSPRHGWSVSRLATTHALWATDDFVICMRCGSWSKLHRPGRGLRVPCSFVPTKKAGTALHVSPKVGVHGNDRVWLQLFRSGVLLFVVAPTVRDVLVGSCRDGWTNGVRSVVAATRSWSSLCFSSLLQFPIWCTFGFHAVDLQGTSSRTPSVSSALDSWLTHPPLCRSVASSAPSVHGCGLCVRGFLLSSACPEMCFHRNFGSFAGLRWCYPERGIHGGLGRAHCICCGLPPSREKYKYGAWGAVGCRLGRGKNTGHGFCRRLERFQHGAPSPLLPPTGRGQISGVSGMV